jgi:hypothetical protein
LSFVFCLLSFVFCLLSFVFCLLSFFLPPPERFVFFLSGRPAGGNTPSIPSLPRPSSPLARFSLLPCPFWSAFAARTVQSLHPRSASAKDAKHPKQPKHPQARRPPSRRGSRNSCGFSEDAMSEWSKVESGSGRQGHLWFGNEIRREDACNERCTCILLALLGRSTWAALAGLPKISAHGRQHTKKTSIAIGCSSYARIVTPKGR